MSYGSVTRLLEAKFPPVYEPATRSTLGEPLMPADPGNRTLAVVEPPAAILPRFGSAVLGAVLPNSTLVS